MNINYSLIKEICLSPMETFRKLGEVTDTPDGMYIYKQNPKARILGVAHLDSVVSLRHFYKLQIKNDTVILNGQLDDRLGVYVMLDLLPKMGIQFDLLLTEGEESGRSTAQHFKTDKQYNWMFSFDRHGNDVVMYQYDCKELRKDLQKVNLRPGYGTFSDIAFMDNLHVRGMNFGVGYEEEHTDMHYASMNVLQSQVKGFQRFYNRFNQKRYSYTPSKWSNYRGWRDESVNYDWRNARWLPENDTVSRGAIVRSDIPDCYLCGYPAFIETTLYGVTICADCLPYAADCQACHDVLYDEQLMDGYCPTCKRLADDMKHSQEVK